MNTRPQIEQSLSALLDRARLQADLLSMGAREEWEALEQELLLIREQLSRTSDKALSVVGERAIELMRRGEGLLQQHTVGELSLASPAERVMTAAVCTCSPWDTLNTPAQVMWDEDCGAVPVVDDMGMLLGMLTDRDLSMACYTQGRAPKEVPVMRAMSSAVYGVRRKAPLAEVIAVMKAHRVRRVPVVTEGGTLIGLVSLADLLRHLPEKHHGDPLAAAVLEALVQISGKHRPSRTVRASLAAE